MTLDNSFAIPPPHSDSHALPNPAEWEVLNILIAQIYDSVLHPEQWNETLARISAELCPLNWESAFILWESNNPPRARFVAATGLAAGVQEMYSAVYAGHHPLSQRLMRYRNGSVVDSHEVMSPEEFGQTKLAKDFLKPWGIDRLIAVMLDRRGGERLGLIIPGPADRDVDGLKRGLRVLAPHIQRALRISDRIANLELAAGAARMAADQSPFAILTLDDQCNILSANSRVASYVKAGVISTRDNRLSFVHPASQRRLADLLRTSTPTGIAFQAIARNGDDCPVLGARVSPHTAPQIGGTATGASLIITLGSSPQETPVVEIDHIGQWFGLTPAEARLAVALSKGVSLQDYAAQRATSVNATRFLLKGVFRKARVTSQAQLVALMAGLPGTA
jgi:DNA-binding CsgD family transcriptional regulator/PAS domain-containing protein